MMFRSRRCRPLDSAAPLSLEVESLEPRMMLSTIQVIAAGIENTESMDLLIDDVVVQTWDNIGGNAYANQYLTFTYNSPDNVTAGQIKVAFTNDLYIQGQTDRNLGVDAIVVDGVRFETEDPSVFGTGTWIPAAGAIVPGFNQTEILHANGYFQYADPLPPTGSQIVINAAGYENEETMQLSMGGSVVRTWTNIGGDGAASQFLPYNYNHSSTVTIDQVRVQFTNDLWDPPNVDRNLRVDNVVLDGVVYETEDPSVFSTGTWKPNDGITPGFRQDEHLHANGYFQFAETGNLNPGFISLETSVFDVNEDDGTVTINVVRTQGADGAVTVEYRTIDQTATAGEDYAAVIGTLTFVDGQTLASVTIDLLNNGVAEPTETFNFTIDNPQGGASLLLPRTAVITIADDDFTIPDYPDFGSTSGLTLNGQAAGIGNELRLTPAVDNQSGSVFYNDALPINADTSFQTEFSFRLNGGQGTNGADGLTFVVHNDAAGASALGNGGQFLGYGGIENSLAIEFDTWQNSTGDINNNHVAILLNGDTINAIDSRDAGVDLNSGGVVYAWVDYNGQREELSVYVSNNATKPVAPVLFASLDLQAVVGNTGYLGFTAATGGSNNTHSLLGWAMNLEVPPAVDPPGPGEELVSVDVISGLNQPTAIQWTPDGSNMYIAEKSGLVNVVSNGVLQATPFLDIRAQVNNIRDRGLLDIAVHPDFTNNPYIYLLYTYDPPEVFQNAGDPLAGPDKKGNRAGRLLRVTADASTNYTTIVAGSELVILGTNSTWNNFNAFANSTSDFNEPPAGILPDGTNIQDFIATDSESHTIGGMDFGPDGALYVSIGDGASYNQVDPRAVRVQDIDNLSGKVLRINPLNGQGYSDNPFYNGDLDANRSKVYYYGLRNPFRIAVNQDTGDVYVGDVGWGTWEEVNVGPAGTNFGWPYYEGASGTNNQTGGYKFLPEAIAFYNSGQIATPAIFALNHASDGINAIVLGDSYNGTAWPAEYDGDVFLNDLGGGIVRNLSFNTDGSLAGSQIFTTGAELYVMMRQGPDGNIYWVDLVDGKVGRWEFV